MRKLRKFNNKVLTFMVGISNAYKSEEEKEGLPKLELIEDELTEDFIAMLMSMKLWYVKLTGDDTDLIGFTHILNRLAVQHCMDSKEEEE